MKPYGVAFLNQQCNSCRRSFDIWHCSPCASHTLQIPIGLEDKHVGVVDLVYRKAFTFEGPNGIEVTERPVPEDMKAQMEEYRADLVEKLAEVCMHVCVGVSCCTSCITAMLHGCVSVLHCISLQHASMQCVRSVLIVLCVSLVLLCVAVQVDDELGELFLAEETPTEEQVGLLMDTHML